KCFTETPGLKPQGANNSSRILGRNLERTQAQRGIINVKSESTFKTIEIQFKLDEPFEETTPDGRETMSIFTLENGKLVQKQTWGGKETTIERQIADDGKLINLVCKYSTPCTLCHPMNSLENSISQDNRSVFYLTGLRSY
uniref:Lipocalin/cytosolic fatty-acid binding domain-containing protein n=1 Tax=Esox lucius TaxID=8010 RepID=A0AAY5L4S7_ESOLU